MVYKDKEEALAHGRKYYQEHREQLLAYAKTKERRTVTKRYRWNLKVETLRRYSDGSVPKCVVCGESDIRVLCLDHMNGNGAEERKRLKIHGGWEFYAWLKRWRFPLGYQVLCMNCNWKKRCSEYDLYGGKNES